MSERPRLALCIPAYNAARFLPRLLASARDQRIPFDETLVYDDSSTDDTATIAGRLGATVLRGNTNLGCSAGKNALLAAARAEWIHFHDADDILLPNFTQLAHRWMARGSSCPDVVLFDFEYRDEITNALLARSHFDANQLRTDAVRFAILHQINPFCGIYRRSRLAEVDGYDTEPEILYNEDVAFHCKLALAGLSFDAENEVSIINYRVAGSMSMANQVKCAHAHLAVMKRVAAKVGHRYPLEIATRLWKTAAVLARHDQWAEVDRALALARSLPSSPPPNEGMLFRAVCRLVGVQLAFRIRENFIRRLKPHLRTPTPRR